MKKVKNRYPTNAVRNKYQDGRKDSCINTPPFIAQRIFDIILPFLLKRDIVNIVDIGCGIGNLSEPFGNSKFTVVGIDIKKQRKFKHTFFNYDFLSNASLEYFYPKSAILCNPPFNDSAGKYGRKLLPELFLRKIFDTWGQKVPAVLFSPMGMIKNQKMSSPRWKWIRDCGCRISSELEIPIDAYGQGILVHSSVLFFNFTGLKPRYFLED